MAFRDLSLWVRSRGLPIVLYAVGSMLLGRFIHWVGERYRRYLDDTVRDQIKQRGVVSERAKRVRTVAQVVEWACEAVMYFLVGLLILNRAGIPFSGLVAPATVVAAALGFGAQQIVQDLLAGFFLFAERQFSIGDLVRMAQPGQAVGITGTVEDLTLRVTRLRTAQGELVFLPNGALRQVTNLSKEWSRVLVDIPIPADQDLEKAVEVLRDVAARMGQDTAMKELLLGEPTLAGVENIEVGYLQLRMIARTLPGKQFEVGRELRLRAALALQEADLVSPAINVSQPDG